MDHAEALNTLRALAEPARLAVMSELAKHRMGLHVGAISAATGIRQNLLSSHLGVLRRAGLVYTSRSGRSVFYFTEHLCLRRLMRFLFEKVSAIAPEMVDRVMRPDPQIENHDMR